MHRILICNDLHDRMQDISTIRGYRKVVNLVKEDLIQIIIDYGVTDLFSLGDWYDSGFSAETNLALLDIVDGELKMSQLLNGNIYTVIGNHINIKMSSNPELFLIQPHPKYKMKEADRIKREQIFKTPDVLSFNGVNFYFMHYDWNELKSGFNPLSYKPKLVDGNVQVGLFHTTRVAPNRYCKFSKTSDDEIAEIFRGLDYAFCGHIHQPIGSFNIGTTEVVIPGSLTNTKNDASLHHTINLPFITIEDDGTFKLEYILNFDLHTDMLEFRERESSGVKSLRGRKLDDFAPDTDISMKIMNTMDWLQNRHDKGPFDIKLCELICNSPTNIGEMLNTYKQINTAKTINVI